MMSTPHQSEPAPPSPDTTLQQAFERVLTKARWGVIGALIGGVVMSGLDYLGDGRGPLYMASVGAVAGAFSGAALSGRGLGAIGWSMVACLVLAGCLCCGSVGHQEGLVLLFACCVALGFLIGAAAELAPHFGSRAAPPATGVDPGKKDEDVGNKG
jgi:hypothetical protein